MEMIDLFDCNERLVVQNRPRWESLSHGQYPKIVGILLEHQEGGFLAMQRDLKKRTAPGKWELSAGGVVRSGETPLHAAQRELQEETGIQGEEWQLLEKFLSEDSQCWCYSFYAKTNQSKSMVQFQEGETIAYHWLTPLEILTYYSQNQLVGLGANYLLRKWVNAFTD